jgi:hypothetical protein
VRDRISASIFECPIINLYPMMRISKVNVVKHVIDRNFILKCIGDWLKEGSDIAVGCFEVIYVSKMGLFFPTQFSSDPSYGLDRV